MKERAEFRAAFGKRAFLLFKPLFSLILRRRGTRRPGDYSLILRARRLCLALRALYLLPQSAAFVVQRPHVSVRREAQRADALCVLRDRGALLLCRFGRAAQALLRAFARLVRALQLPARDALRAGLCRGRVICRAAHRAGSPLLQRQRQQPRLRGVKPVLRAGVLRVERAAGLHAARDGLLLHRVLRPCRRQALQQRHCLRPRSQRLSLCLACFKLRLGALHALGALSTAALARRPRLLRRGERRARRLHIGMAPPQQQLRPVQPRGAFCSFQPRLPRGAFSGVLFVARKLRLHRRKLLPLAEDESRAAQRLRQCFRFALGALMRGL